MKISDRIINTAFHEQGISGYVLAEKVGELASIHQSSGIHSILDRAAVASSDAFQSMLIGYDPRQVARDVFKHSQEISLDAYCMDLSDNEERAKHQEGVSAEVAVHGLLWWGIGNVQNFGRYARIATTNEDSSSSYGAKNGFDIVFRSMRKRHKIQVKKGFLAVTPSAINKYAKDIFIVSPQHLLGDPDSETNDLHEAIVAEDADVLHSGINRFIQVLHTQKTINGRRKVI